jgi:hypothetical protein
MTSAAMAAGSRIALVRDYIPSDEQPGGGRPARLAHLPQAHRAELCRGAAADPAHIRTVRESCLLTGLWIESRFEIIEYV